MRTLATRPRRLVGALTAVLLLGIAPQAVSAERPFSPRFSTNDTGSIVGVGNTLMTCPTSASGCADARSHGPTTTASSRLNNDNWSMTYVDVDDDASTFSSSRATLQLPAGAEVLFAGLYWGGDSSGAPSASQRDRVKLRVPGASGYASITGTVDSASVSGTDYFQGFADVTDRVRGAGAGVYAVADVQSGTGTKHFAGWALIVAYRHTGEPARNLTVFDGLKVIRSNDPPTTIDVSGFRTPPAGQVRTELGLVTYEGDLGIVGDTASLNGTALEDAQHPRTNYFDSALSVGGAPMPGRTPSYANQLGYDITFQNADGLLGNDATSAQIRVTTSGDQYVPGVITFATELHAPRIEQTKSVVDVDGGEVQPGDRLEYTVKGRNTGQDAAVDLVLRDPIPAGTTYVPGSLTVVDGAGGATGAQTDAAGDDLAEHAGGAVTFRLGSGASATAGGRVAPGASYEVRFAVTVDGGVAAGTRITNVATASLRSERLGTPLTAVSDAAVTVTAAGPASADLSIDKTASDAHPSAGDVVTYTLKVRNHGPDAARDVKVVDALPPGVTFLSASSPCTQAGGVVTCELGELAPGATRTLTIRATADPLPVVGGASFPAEPHLVPVEKVERQVDVEPGETAEVVLTCPQAGQILTDGSVRVDAVDQGTGTPASVVVERARGTKANAWKAVLRNDAGGRAQAKAFAVCVAGATSEAAGHRHDLVVSAPVTEARTLAAGRHTVTVACPTGTSPIVPGWAFDGGTARVVASEPAASGWRFGIDVEEPTAATLSARCLDREVARADGHTHDLRLEHRVKQVAVPAGQVVEAEVTCADDAKGIVASWELADGLVMLGNDPRPKTRAFRLLNPTGHDAKATIDLECLGDRTGKGRLPGAAPRTVENTATVKAETADPNPANDRAGATIEVRGRGAVVAAAPATVAGRRIALRVACPAGKRACAGTLKVASRGGVAGRGRFKVAAGTTRAVRLELQRTLGRKAAVTLQAKGAKPRTRTLVVRR